MRHWQHDQKAKNIFEKRYFINWQSSSTGALPSSTGETNLIIIRKIVFVGEKDLSKQPEKH